MTTTTDKPYTEIPIAEPGTPEWHEARLNGIGASEVAAVMGLNPYRTARDVWMVKTGRETDQESNLAMRAGTFMEPFILSEYELATGRTGSKPAIMYRSKQAPWLTANLDWLSDDHQLVVDAKRSEAPTLWGDSGTDEVPKMYFVQMQVQALIMGVSQSELAVLLPRNDLRIYPIPPVSEIQQRIIEETGEFWEKYVKTDTPPPITEVSEGSLASVKQLYNRVEPHKVTLADPVSITVEKFLALKEQIKGLGKERDALEAIILDQIGNADAAEIPGRYTMKRTLIEKKPYTVIPKPYTTLRIKEISE